eukprot:g4476.t1
MSLPDDVLEFNEINTQADFHEYVLSYKNNVELLREHVADENKLKLNYRQLYIKSGTKEDEKIYSLKRAKLHNLSHVKARDQLKKIIRKQKLDKYAEMSIKRQAFATKNQLMSLAKLWGNAGPPTLNSAIKRQLHYNKREAKKYEKAKAESTDWQQSLRFGYYSHEVNLQWMELPHVPKGLLNTLAPTVVRALRLTGNDIYELPPSICVLSCMEELNISNNKISFIPATIKYLRVLRILDVSYNRLATLNSNCSKLKSLRVLKVQGNILHELPYNVGELLSLEQLYAQQNKLTWIPVSFKELLSLKVLNLSENAFAALPLCPTYSDDWGKSKSKVVRVYENWSRVVGPNFEETYVDLSTGKAQRSLPEAMLLGQDCNISLVNLSGYEDKYIQSIEDVKSKIKVTEGMKVVLEERQKARKRRLTLKKDGKREWEALADSETGDTFFFNHITHEKRPKMPKSLDRFGELKNLVTLKLNTGQLQTLPDSLFLQKRPLQVLEVKMNRLKLLQDGISNLISLREIRLPGNQLVQIPEGIGMCTQLQIIDFTANNIRILPRSLGKCVQLKKLWLSHNRIREIPPTYAHMTELREIMIGHNQIKARITEALSVRGLPGFLHMMKENLLREERGLPPDGRKDVNYGVDGALERKKIRHTKHLQEEIAKAYVTNRLHYFWKALPEIDEEILKCTNLVDLRLTGNAITFVPEGISVLKSLRILNLRNNKITQISERGLRGAAGSLEVLDLADNKLTKLPERIFRCRKVQKLHLENNVLTHLPEQIGKMRSIRELTLQTNMIEFLPRSICMLMKVKSLNLERNNLSSLPETLCDMKSLEILNLNHNRFNSIPDVLGKMIKLKELQIASNNIDQLNPSFLLGEKVSQSLAKLWVQNNKIVDLPLKFANLKSLKDCRFDGNPLRSPPIDIAEEGVFSVEKYLVERSRRHKLLLEGLAELGFQIQETNLYPKTTDLFSGGTGYMLVEDKKDFDNRVDSYLNADIYSCAWSGNDILKDLKLNRYTRARETYRTIITIILKALRKLTRSESKSKWYEGDEVVSDFVSRPWGENGSQTQCYQFTLRVLLDGAHGKKSLLSLIANGKIQQLSGNDIDGYLLIRQGMHYGFKKRLVDTSNYLDIDNSLIIDALNNYVGPYGRCSIIEPMQTECTCAKPHSSADEERLHHLVQEAAVIQKVIVTDEEAARKREEDYEIKMYGKLVERKTEQSFSGKTGLKLIRTKVKELKEQTKEDLRSCKDEFKAANNKNKKAENDLMNIQKRKEVYDEKPASVELHGFTSLRQAQQAVAKAQKAQVDAEEELRAVEDKETKLKQRKKLSSKKWREEAMIAIVEEKRDEERRRIVQDHRIEAMKMGWRRPWDGENGEDFIRWVAARKGADEAVFDSDDSSSSEDEAQVTYQQSDSDTNSSDSSTFDDESTDLRDDESTSDDDNYESTADDTSLNTGSLEHDSDSGSSDYEDSDVSSASESGNSQI